MGTIHYISVDGTTRQESANCEPEHSVCAQYLDGERERVWVLFKDKRTCMLVNENGIALGLPINAAATEIYHAWPKRQGMNVTGRHIHGNAIVLENIK